MSAPSESVASRPAGDWDTPFRGTPSSSDGEFSRIGANAVVADRTALTFSETSRTPVDGDMSKSQGKFPTTNSRKKS
jgi:hypothetical protein